MRSLPLARAPESQLTAEQSSTGRHWNSPKKIPYIQRQRRSHTETCFCCFYGKADLQTSSLHHSWKSCTPVFSLLMETRPRIFILSEETSSSISMPGIWWEMSGAEQMPTNKDNYYSPLSISMIPEQDLEVLGLSNFSGIWNPSILWEIATF